MNLQTFFRLLISPFNDFKTYLSYRKKINGKGGYIDHRVQLKINGIFTFDSPIYLCVEGIDVPNKSLIWVKESGELHIGTHSGLTASSIVCTNRIHIGSYVNIGANTLIIDSDFHSLYWKDRENRLQDVQKAKSAAITIGDYAFIGARSVITKGVTIGERSIVAAGSVVVKDIPSDEIWGGNPAQFIRKVPSSTI